MYRPENGDPVPSSLDTDGSRETFVKISPDRLSKPRAILNTVQLADLVAAFVFALAAAWMAYLANGHATRIDDSEIFFTYAQNLASGKGLLFSEGIPRVEGYTSTLWMLLSALMFLVGLDERGVLIVSIALLTCTTYLAFRVISRLSSGLLQIWGKILYVTLAATSFGYISWTTVTLMDTGVWTALIASMVFMLLFNPTTVKGWMFGGAPFCLAILARPEALIVAPAILALIGVDRLARKQNIRPVLCIAGGILATAALLTVFRIAYFGYPFPSTYYAKVSPELSYNLGEGFLYLTEYALTNALPSLTAVAAASLGAWYLVRIAPHVFIARPFDGNEGVGPSLGKLSLVICLLLILPFATGGDHFRLHRLYQPAYPLICLVVAICAQRAVAGLFADRTASLVGSKGAAVVAAPLFAFLWGVYFSATPTWPAAFQDGSPIAHEFQFARGGRALGEQLNRTYDALGDKRPGVGVIVVGGFSRTYAGPVYDLMGLNNSFIAHFPGERIGVKNHAAFEKDAFFSLGVDALVDSPDNPFADAVLKGLFKDPRFVEAWSYGRLSQVRDGSLAYEGFFRKGFIADAVATGKYDFTPSRTYSPETSTWQVIS